MRLLYSLLLFLIGLTNYAQQLPSLQLVSPEDDYVYDIRYAGKNNFLEQAFYKCAKCYLRPEVAEALEQAREYFYNKGYKILLYDCFRPVEAQIKMWKAFPNPRYVANPYTKGSVHSRGAAVDISLIHRDGSTVAMGTDHDHFGKEAHIDHHDLPEHVLKNRALLQKGMRKFGFNTIRTEWWHFDYKNGYSYPIIKDELPCQNQ